MAEKDTLSLLILSNKLRSGRMAQWYEASLSTLEEAGVQVQIPAAGLLAVYLYFFFVFVFFHFYPFACTPNCNKVVIEKSKKQKVK